MTRSDVVVLTRACYGEAGGGGRGARARHAAIDAPANRAGRGRTRASPAEAPGDVETVQAGKGGAVHSEKRWQHANHPRLYRASACSIALTEAVEERQRRDGDRGGLEPDDQAALPVLLRGFFAAA